MAHVHTIPRGDIGGRPINSMLVQFPVVCFTLALLTDIAYWHTANLMWQNFSSWLLFAGLIFGAFAALASTAGLLFRSTARDRRAIGTYAIGGVLVLAMAFVNSLIHAGDGWTAIVPWGLVLSAMTVIAMVVTAWFGRVQASSHESMVRE